MDVEKLYREDHTFYKAVTGDFNAKVGPRRTPGEFHTGTHDLQWDEQGERLSEGRNPRTIINWDLFATLAGFWEDSAMDNIDEECDWLVEHLHDCAKKAESFKTTKRRLSLEALELIRQRGAARTAGNQALTSELARLCREAIKEDLRERRAEVLAEAAEAGKSQWLEGKRKIELVSLRKTQPLSHSVYTSHTGQAKQELVSKSTLIKLRSDLNFLTSLLTSTVFFEEDGSLVPSLRPDGQMQLDKKNGSISAGFFGRLFKHHANFGRRKKNSMGLICHRAKK
ncbi:hypothetical protein NECAME_00761 [Necator americanus]|uniref:Uncharacterized protein n=1 Tax=Necator americanus TaxID=51031 RepID=W2SVV3_NECAM|nr:hypothetical protein NECAME_00761 [Necator americanus]ETN73673.1 hypothetical protein NECAME_00761 [Necator americanus]